MEKAGPKSSTGMAGQQKTPANAHLGTEKPRAFDADGSIGKQFTEDGAIGGTAQKLGGPFDKDGAFGKQFTEDGAIGSSVQNTMGGTKTKSA